MPIVDLTGGTAHRMTCVREDGTTCGHTHRRPKLARSCADLFAIPSYTVTITPLWPKDPAPLERVRLKRGTWMERGLPSKRWSTVLYVDTAAHGTRRVYLRDDARRVGVRLASGAWLEGEPKPGQSIDQAARHLAAESCEAAP